MKKILANLLSHWPILLIFFATIIFFFPVFKGKMPFPGDTLIGAYYPWRDLSWQGRTTEYPLKNMTISDATSQLYPWRYLVIKQIKEGKWPLWNNYEFSGTPLLAIPQAAAFYPLNFLFFIFSFNTAWIILVMLQPFLGGTFFYLFLRNKKLSKTASCLGAICFSFGSYFLLSTEFNLLGHTALWFPLALLAIDKLFEKNRLLWFLVLLFSLVMAILAGFIQFLVYGYILLFVYTLFRFLFGKGIVKKSIFSIFLGLIVPIFLTSLQLFPFMELIRESGRMSAYGDLSLMTRFFVPLPQLLMFFIPDFFGNPATANYWGKPNYYEFNGYFGILSLAFILYLILTRKLTKEILFWLGITFTAFLFVISNPVSLLPYNLKTPFLSSLVPARLLFFTSFALPILTALGYEDLFKKFSPKKIKILIIALGLVTVIPLIAFLDMSFVKFFGNEEKIAPIVLRNLVLPGVYLVSGFILLISCLLFKKRAKLFLFLILLLVLFDLSREGRKFLTFFDPSLTYPETGITKFLKENLGYSRFFPLHQEIFGTNHQTVYGLEGIEGYASFYNSAYGTFIARGQEDNSVDGFRPAFERTVFGRNYRVNVFNLLSAKYFLSFENLNLKDYPLVFKEGRTKVYENKKALPRAFLACGWERREDPFEIIKRINLLDDPSQKIFVQQNINVDCQPGEKVGEAKITYYSDGQMSINIDAPADRILVAGDIFFPGWKVFIDNKLDKVLKVDYVLKGVVVPGGKHEAKFLYDPESFKIGLKVSVVTLVLLIGISSFIITRKKWR